MLTAAEIARAIAFELAVCERPRMGESTTAEGEITTNTELPPVAPSEPAPLADPEPTDPAAAPAPEAEPASGE